MEDLCYNVPITIETLIQTGEKSVSRCNGFFVFLACGHSSSALFVAYLLTSHIMYGLSTLDHHNIIIGCPSGGSG